MERRDFLTLGTAVAAGAALPWRARAAWGGFGEKRYEGAMVINALGGLEDSDATSAEAPPSERLLRDVRSSGVTAVSMTLSVGSTGDRMMKAIRKIAIFDEKVAAAPDLLMRVRKAADLQSAKATRRLGLIYNFQDSSLFENDLTRVALFQQLGVRVMQITYNTRNLAGDGCLERANSGLSNLGRQLVAAMNQARVVVDLSHSGQRTIAEGIAESQAPPVISHTGCRDLVDRPRNTYDTELKALANKGGVAGIYFMPFLAVNGAATSADLIRHIEHAVNICGEDHVGLGTDGSISGIELTADYRESLRKEYKSREAQGVAAPGETPDEVEFIADYNEPRRFLHLADDLAVRGWPTRRIEKVLGENFARVYREVWA
jgi:membrane dipeptidase